jgi:hypothetical protein
MSGRSTAPPRRSRWRLLAFLPVLLALGCEEGARTGSVYRVRVPYGPWWVSQSVYDRSLALGRPTVLTPPSAATGDSTTEATEDDKARDETSDEE